jgi:hypothetical protein
VAKVIGRLTEVDLLLPLVWRFSQCPNITDTESSLRSSPYSNPRATPQLLLLIILTG